MNNDGGQQENMPGLVINKSRLLIYLVYCTVLAACYLLIVQSLPDPSQLPALTLAFGIGCVVPSCIVFRQELDLLEPVYWFSAMYFAFFLGAVYFILTDFQYSRHNLIGDTQERDRILLRALSLILISYLLFLTGYLTATLRIARARIRFPGTNQVPDWLIGWAVIALLVLGSLNFVYLVTNYPGGLTQYYSEMGLRQHRLDAFGDGVTTAGLQLIYAAIWLWLFVLMRKIQNGVPRIRGQIIAFSITAIISAAVLASQGRLFQTISYCLALAAMFYAFSTSRNRNMSMLLGGGGLILAGLGLFFGRLLSLLIYNRPELFASLSIGTIVETFFRALGSFVLDSGNVTDLTSFMNILAFWESDYSYLYGSSFLSPIARITGGIEAQSIAEMTQAGWSTGVGAWPPTFTGELYANFGIVGVLAGMLIAGFIIGRVYVFMSRRNSYWMTLALCVLTFRFFFILPKGELVNLAGAVWLIFPALITFGLIKLIAYAAQHK